MNQSDRPTLWRRMAATLLDNAIVAAPLGILAAVNYTAIRDGEQPPLGLSTDAVRWLIPCCVTIPAAILLGTADRWGGTPGKRTMGLHTRPMKRSATIPHSSTLPLGQAILRSLLKTSLPWELGHQAVWDLRSGRTPRGAVLAVLAYGLIAAQIIAAARNRGRTYADRAAGTVVKG